MRLITDENISWRLKKLIPAWDILPSNEIVNAKADDGYYDMALRQRNHYSILTFDEDFSEIQNLYSYPPKIIWLRTGNVSTQEIASLLIGLKDNISHFINDDELGIYEIYL